MKERQGLRVFYGYTKLTKKIMKKPMLGVMFENGHLHSNDAAVKRHFLDVIHTRYQSLEEEEDSEGAIRVFTEYRYFINESPWFGDIEKILEHNFEADKNHVSLEERELIREKLRSAYYSYRLRYPEQTKYVSPVGKKRKKQK